MRALVLTEVQAIQSVVFSVYWLLKTELLAYAGKEFFSSREVGEEYMPCQLS